MKKLFKVSKELKTDVSNPAGPSDPYWKDVVAVFNMQDTLEGYTGISSTTPIITKQHPKLGFTSGWGSQGRMIQTSNSYGLRLDLPSIDPNSDFTLEGYAFIGSYQPSKYFITIGSNASNSIRLNTTTTSGQCLYYPNGWANGNTYPSWPFGSFFTYSVVLNNLILATYVNGKRLSYTYLSSKPSIDFSKIFLGCYNFDSTTYNIGASYGPLRLTKRARYLSEYSSPTSHFTYPTHG